MYKKGERIVNYLLDKSEDLNYIIENYSQAKPFSSFLPGIAGLMGIPMWCFYVNRGQAVVSFGIENKDGSIMEFQPANKAYRCASTQGFRTFLKFNRCGQKGFYEPFQENIEFNVQNRMIISPYELSIEERNETLGFLIKVTYFTIPGEPIAALARKVTITNLLDTQVDLELIDGMPVIIPYGMWDFYMKNMSRTIEAWTYVENLENQIPYYRLKVRAEDSAEVIQIEAGNFYCAFCKEADGIKKLKTIIDPSLIFGHLNDLSFPFEFCKDEFTINQEQHYENRTVCAMGHAIFKFAGNEEKIIYSLIGHAENLCSLNNLSDGFFIEEFFNQKACENKRTIRDIMDMAFVNSSSKEFNSYCRQNFLDNILRGGFPLSIKDGDKSDVLYVYSRRHGDLERDYNSFKLMPTFFSQGNGAYRDINQNRRNDIWFNTDTGYSNILYFINLIQLDGYNPLIIKGMSYLYINDGENNILKQLVETDFVEEMLEFLKKPFIPHSLLNFIKTKQVALKVKPDELLRKMLLHTTKIEEAEHGEGYWTDHWHYNIDLLESYEALFADNMEKLLTSERLFSFYEDEHYVCPRTEKYVISNGRPRQFESIKKDKEKLSILIARKVEPNKVRTKNGRGEIYYTSLLIKLISLCVNKVASLDSNGIGIEMEAGKPNWNDALNGLPSLFGSSINETFELKRLILLLQEWIVRYELKGKKVEMPFELKEFMVSLFEALKENNVNHNADSDYIYWDSSNNLKEAYREKVRYGVDGRETITDIDFLYEFLNIALSKIERGICKAYNTELGIYNTYFINEPIAYDILTPTKKTDTGLVMEGAEKQYVRVKEFKQIPLPPFLEGQVHALRVERDIKKAADLYKAILKTELYDENLGMYKVNASLKEFPMELGRLRTFSPGWLENESVFMHMEHKYLLELIKSGLMEEFHSESKKAFVPFMKPEVYGRSVFENSSFIASSVNPDKNMRGNGFVARLSGTTAEFYEILLIIALGVKPFYLNKEGYLQLKLCPSLPGWIFTKMPTKTNIYIGGEEREITFEANTYSFRLLGNVLLVLHNKKRLNTYGADSAKVISISIQKNESSIKEFMGNVIQAPYAAEIRDGIYNRIDVILE